MCQNVSTLVLTAMAQHKVAALVILAEGAANLVLSVILIRKIGLAGVAWGTVIPDLICTSVIIPWLTLRKLNLGVGEYLKGAFLGPVIAAIPAGILAYTFSEQAVTPSWPRFGGEIALICSAVAVSAYFICLDSGHRAVVRDRMRRTFQKSAVATGA
jgi:O-antigen/teichoic acid export membrane protein